MRIARREGIRRREACLSATLGMLPTTADGMRASSSSRAGCRSLCCSASWWHRPATFWTRRTVDAPLYRQSCASSEVAMAVGAGAGPKAPRHGYRWQPSPPSLLSSSCALALQRGIPRAVTERVTLAVTAHFFSTQAFAYYHFQMSKCTHHTTQHRLVVCAPALHTRHRRA